ncbi:hypothetical protein EC396_17200 [Lutibacter sp. HS1-25]|uniref:nuclear transport factor 2 family protein n=1 Tax=Lutibacter sp. HS1-25 TaxID=2485000 RepID=UPI001010EF97|nr:nuclear transport factor 2 family protein [Lutibacter sp. HS1-25]RXP44495.1 hypothetical protein EC396_17200 [Lutibacter sp. HS1-25]
MNKLAIIVVLITLFTSCNCKVKSIDEAHILEAKTEISEVLDTWHLNASNANFDAYFNALSSNAVFVGTDALEVWDVKQFKNFSKPYFDVGEAWNFNAIDRNIYLNETGELAWFDELLNTWMGICRGSGVLKKIDNNWKIEHYVLSVTVPNDNVQKVIAVNKEKDSLFLSNFNR